MSNLDKVEMVMNSSWRIDIAFYTDEQCYQAMSYVSEYFIVPRNLKTQVHSNLLENGRIVFRGGRSEDFFSIMGNLHRFQGIKALSASMGTNGE